MAGSSLGIGAIHSTKTSAIVDKGGLVAVLLTIEVFAFGVTIAHLELWLLRVLFATISSSLSRGS